MHAYNMSGIFAFWLLMYAYILLQGQKKRKGKCI